MATFLKREKKKNEKRNAVKEGQHERMDQLKGRDRWIERNIGVCIYLEKDASKR